MAMNDKTLLVWHVAYWAWPDGSRIKTTGEFDIAGDSKEEVIEACLARWPEMNITSIEVKS